MRIWRPLTVAFAITIFVFRSGHAWNDETHIAVAKASGFSKAYWAVGADMTILKIDSEGLNHYFDNGYTRTVTAKMVLDQVVRYNNPEDKEGHLYGAIIASLRDYQQGGDKYKGYPLGYPPMPPKTSMPHREYSTDAYYSTSYSMN